MKYTKNVLWLQPFVESVEHLLPEHRIKIIRGYHVAKGLEEQTFGSTIKEGRKCSINIRLKDLVTKRKHSNSRIATVLDTLAHELSHVAHWEHTPEHFLLQAKILVKFARVLKKLNVKDTSLRWR